MKSLPAEELSERIHKKKQQRTQSLGLKLSALQQGRAHLETSLELNRNETSLQRLSAVWTLIQRVICGTCAPCETTADL